MSDLHLTRRAALATILMAGAAAAGHALVPTKRMAEMRGPFKLEELVPASFGDWVVDDHTVSGIVNPQTAAMLDRLYSQLLDRVYIDTAGHRIMVSIAYGADQTDDSVQLHYPEVCYPAQGFQLKEKHIDVIKLAHGEIRVRRLETNFGEGRFEPVTYWTVIGDQQSLGGWDRKLAEIRHGIHGEIVDGLLFRVSSLGRDTPEAFRIQDAFVREIVAAMTPKARLQLAGLS
jgi:EpsI family protein